MRLLITGATGFVGQSLVRSCPGQWTLRLTQHLSPLQHASAEIVQVDLSRLEDCLRACEGVDAIVHAAGSVGSVALAADGAMDSIVTNLVLTSRLLQAARACKVKRFLLFGSTTGYPEQDDPLGEEDMDRGSPPPAYFGYGWMRRYLEKLGAYVNQTSATEVVVLRPWAIYGPGDRSAHVIPSLLRKALAGQDPFEVWGGGQEMRDFLYVDDLARACYLALEKLQPGRPVHLTSESPCSIAQLAELILQVSGHKPGRIVYKQDRPAAVSGRRFDMERAHAELGFIPQVTLQQGMRHTWDWCKLSESHF